MNDTIMVVEDESVLLSFIKELLSINHYGVETYTNGSDAFAAFQQCPDKYAIVVTDQSMPGMSGVELLQKIAQIKTVSTILCSGHSDYISHDVIGKVEVGAILEKPFDMKEFLGTVAKMMPAQAS